MDREITGKIGIRLDEGQENSKALIQGFLDYVTEQVLKTGFSDPIVDDMGMLLDLYSCNCNQSGQDKDIFYANIFVELITCFEDLNEDKCTIVLDKSFSSIKKCSIKRSENIISLVPSDDNKENMITLFNYINKKFVKKKDHDNKKYRKQNAKLVRRNKNGNRNYDS